MSTRPWHYESKILDPSAPMHSLTPAPLTKPIAQPGKHAGRVSLSRRKSSGVTLRALFVGLIGVICICLLVPYNDYTFANTPPIGNHWAVVHSVLIRPR